LNSTYGAIAHLVVVTKTTKIGTSMPHSSAVTAQFARLPNIQNWHLNDTLCHHWTFGLRQKFKINICMTHCSAIAQKR
jgi:hypothetical protein